MKKPGGEEQYLQMLKDVIRHGKHEENERTGTGTMDLFGYNMRFDLSDGTVPLLTTKKMFHHGIITELIWFCKGLTNIKWLIERKANFWTADAHRVYCKDWQEHPTGYLRNISGIHYDELKDAEMKKFYEKHGVPVGDACNYRPYTLKEFSDNVLEDKEFAAKFAELNGIYSKQWRGFDGIDQLQNLVDTLKNNPSSRRMIVTAWNPKEIEEMALPPCHCLFQFHSREMSYGERVRELNRVVPAKNLPYSKEETDEMLEKFNIPTRRLSCQLYQRSSDTFLGVPFNIASYSILVHIVAKMVNMAPGEFIWVSGSTHIYSNHMSAINEQLMRKPLGFPKISLAKKDYAWENLEIEDINIVDYQCHEKITAELNVG